MEDITIINGTLVICSDGTFYMPNQAMEKWPWIRKYIAECFWDKPPAICNTEVGQLNGGQRDSYTARVGLLRGESAV